MFEDVSMFSVDINFEKQIITWKQLKLYCQLNKSLVSSKSTEKTQNKMVLLVALSVLVIFR